MAAPVTITFLGGLGEIGRNCMVLECEGKLLLLDCGLMFPELEHLGVDLILPDFTWLRENADRIIGCICTHGHEDHVGGLSYLLREMSFPLYGSALTLGLARNRIEEAGLLAKTDFNVVTDGERRKIGPFDVEFIPVTHSVPHGFATAFHTPQGVVMHTGDWKLDLTPVDGRLTDLARMGSIAYESGVRLLMGDSTNADSHGHSRSEKSVGAVLQGLFQAQEGRRIVIACFASHVHRVQQVADAAVGLGRKVATLGLSMKKNVRLAREMGLLHIPESALIDIEDIGDYPDGEVCVVCTGSQGEPMSALTRMANRQNRWITLGDNDTVILSSHPIPGNEMSVTKVIDGLVRLGSKVIHSDLEDVHATGHAKQEEIKTLLSVVEPQWFVPVHGEYRHLVSHAELAQTMGVPAERTLVCEDGDQITIDDEGIHRSGNVPAGYLYVDGIVGDVGQGVLRDRRVLAEEGVVVVVVSVAISDGAILTGPEIITRGWVYAPEAEALLDECADVVRQAIKSLFAEAGEPDLDAIQRTVRRAAGRFVNDRTKRKPMIVPVVMEA
jgi:ribonuclease J